MELLVDRTFDGSLPLCEEESMHCVKVLRHRVGDEVWVTDGQGTLYRCRVDVANSRSCELTVLESEVKPPFRHYLHMAVAPTKNIDRFEWFVEKATELGISEITPIICEHSEREKVRLDRLERLVVAAAKQSLKCHLPKINEPCTAKALIERATEEQRYILHCAEGEKEHLFNEVRTCCSTLVMIGPEGDFSKGEVSKALSQGFKEATLGEERLRTETAALAACHIVDLKNNI